MYNDAFDWESFSHFLSLQQVNNKFNKFNTPLIHRYTNLYTVKNVLLNIILLIFNVYWIKFKFSVIKKIIYVHVNEMFKFALTCQKIKLQLNIA